MNELHQTVRFRGLEYVHIYLWLLKDICWVKDWKFTGTFMIFPTVAFAALILWLQRSSRAELVHNFAVLSWICANSTWMVGEFFYNDCTRPFAVVFFLIGLITIGSYYALTLAHRYGGSR